MREPTVMELRVIGAMYFELKKPIHGSWDIPDRVVIAMARAAIRAMREPTKEMKSAGEAVDYVERGEYVGGTPSQHWHAMIDSASPPDTHDEG